MSSTGLLPQHVQEVSVNFDYDTETKPKLKLRVRVSRWLRYALGDMFST